MIEQLYNQKKLPRLSLILNDIKLERAYYGGYYGGYGYSSTYGYGFESGYFEQEKGHKKPSIFRQIQNGIKRLFS